MLVFNCSELQSSIRLHKIVPVMIVEHSCLSSFVFGYSVQSVNFLHSWNSIVWHSRTGYYEGIFSLLRGNFVQITRRKGTRRDRKGGMCWDDHVQLGTTLWGRRYVLLSTNTEGSRWKGELSVMDCQRSPTLPTHMLTSSFAVPNDDRPV